MVRRAYIKSNTYQDSVSLMRLSSMIAKMDGIGRASVMMGTALNKKVLEEIGMTCPEVEGAQTSDMMLIVEAEDDGFAERAFENIENQLNMESKVKEESGDRLPVSISEVVQAGEGFNLAAISTPGEFAAAEAMKALKNGLNVFLFSDNVSVESEVRLKKYARAHDLLVMGPDCGTSVLRGVPLGFANVVGKGDIGLIGASGTGLQEVACRITQLNGGISNVIGTGSHDLSREVGGISMLQALDLLEADAQTKVVVLVSKPPEKTVAENIAARAAKMRCPVVICFLDAAGLEPAENITVVDTLEQAARAAVALSRGEAVPGFEVSTYQARLPAGRYLRGLYSGGTLAHEALTILKKHGVHACSNLTADSAYALRDPRESRETCVVDMGDDKFTVGRPHPMIDYGDRIARIRREAASPDVAVFLLDVVLGFGSNADPGGAFAAVIGECRARRPELQFVVHVCGTEDDKQGLKQQCALLEKAGAHVELSHVEAVEKALRLLEDSGQE